MLKFKKDKFKGKISKQGKEISLIADRWGS